MKTSLIWLLTPLAWAFWCSGGLAMTCVDLANHSCLYSAVEPAGSKGSQSMALGYGITNTTTEADDGPAQVLRVYLSKGFSFPVDIGLLLGTTPTGEFQQRGLHVQWTVFEGFRLPAATVRGTWLNSSWSAWENDPGSSSVRAESVDSSSLEAIISWGILGILTPYAGIGRATLGGATSIEQFAGLEIQAAPPFMRVGIETRSAFASRSIAAKVSVGL